MKFWNYIYFFVLFTSITLFPQEDQIRFSHFSVKNGLSHSAVFNIAQDKYGFMWFATEDGLNRFDGYEFTVFRHDPLDVNSVSDFGIRKIFIDKSGLIWVITITGKLDRYYPDENRFIHYELKTASSPDSKNAVIISITEDMNGTVWAVSNRGLFFCYDRRSDKFVKKEFEQSEFVKISNIHLQVIAGDNSGLLWIGTWEGLYSFNINSGKVTHYLQKDYSYSNKSESTIIDINCGNDGNIWMATSNRGIVVYNTSLKSFKSYRHKKNDAESLSSDRLLSIHLDSNSNLWAGTVDKGLSLLKEGSDKFVAYTHSSVVEWSISKGAVMDVFEDKNGGLWFGTYGGGINYFNPRLNRFNFMSHNFIDKGSINPNTVLSILEDRSGALFVGTDGGGLNVRFPGSNDFEHFLKNPGSVGSNSITSLTEDKNGNVWIGTDPGINNKSGAVLLFNRNKKSFITLNNIDIVFGGISSLYVDSKNNLWIALATDGLRKYNIESKTTETFRVDKNNPQSIPTNSIFSIIEDDDGFIWLGTPGSGLLRLDVDKKIFKTYLSDPKNQNSISSNAVWTVAKDNNGDLWFGTWGGGLNKYNKNDNTFQRFTEKEGLSGNVIYGIIPDSKGFIWLSTNKGISRIDLSELKINNFDLSNGLPSIEFSLNAFCMDKEKKLYFGGTEGITFFDPERITGNSFIPPVLITKIYVQGEELKLLKPAYMIHEIELDYDQNFFSFEFSALDYSASKKNVYKYRLEGVDKDWLFTSGRRFANYTDISPGRYVFRLKSSNNDGVWSNNDVTLSIIIHPPFWATWWFRAAGVALLILLLYSVHKYRLNRLLEVERTRIKIARDLHDEVSASITGIVYFADAIKSELNEKESPEVNKLVNLIGESANQIQESMSDIIWSINPENDDWNIVLPKFRRFASDLCESKNIVYNIDISENAFARPLKMEQRHELWLIFKEIVTNAVKHSECSFMSINLFGDMENIHLIVEDNGKGFDSSVPSPNNGIKNIKSRTKSLEGTAELITEREKGTKWIVKIPLTKNR